MLLAWLFLNVPNNKDMAYFKHLNCTSYTAEVIYKGQPKTVRFNDGSGYSKKKAWLNTDDQEMIKSIENHPNFGRLILREDSFSNNLYGDTSKNGEPEDATNEIFEDVVNAQSAREILIQKGVAPSKLKNKAQILSEAESITPKVKFPNLPN